MRDSAPTHSLATLFSQLTAPASAPSALARTARAVTTVWLVVSAINFVVWLLVSVIGGSVDSPWWLWAFAGGGAVVGGLHVAARSYGPATTSHPEFDAAGSGDADADGDDW